jgi:ATP-dependent Zn protease
MKETPKTQQVLLKKTEKLEKKCITRVNFFFSFDSSSEKITRRGGKLRHKRDLSSNKQTNNNTSERTKERREQNRKSWHTWPPLSLLLRFWCFPFRRRRRLVEEGGGGAKEAPIIR